MIDIDELKYLISEDYLKEISSISATIKDLLNDMELLTKVYIEDKNMTSVEVATFFRCETSQIPKEIPCIKIGRNYLYKKSDIDKWLLDHKRNRS